MVKIPPSNGEGLIPGQGLGSHMRHSESKKKKKRCQRVDENDVREE